ncbi:MAG: tetratricopeptide repeat protein [Pseudomonadota bacterium]
MPGDHQARPFTLLDHICSPSVLEELIKSAEEGHEGAQYYVGAMLFDGMCGEMDEAEGLIWILQAAERGLIDAQHDYGRLSLESATTQEQRYRALYWLGAAAGQGDALSALTLARMHEAGLHGLDQNICLALDWYAAGEALGNDDLIDHAQSLRATSPDC